MYESKFQLSDRPFAPSPKADAYFASSSSEAARGAVARCLLRAEGVALLIGGPGLGKSMMARVLERDLRPQMASIVINSAGLCTRRSLLSTIAAGLEMKRVPLDEGDLRMAIVDQLESKSAGNVVLLVDEAHTLPLRLLEELRLLTNALHHGEPRVRIALIGNTRLEERIANSKLESFAQRVACRQYLSPLTKAETAEYIRRELFRCGADADRILDPAAATSVFAATDGIPRLVNQMCDHALVLAAVLGKERIDCESIEEAWADLQQLPAPWNESRADASSVVEFGELPGELGPADPTPFYNPVAHDAISHDVVSQVEASFVRTSNSISLLASDDLLPAEVAPLPQASNGLSKPSRSLSRTPEVELVFNASSLLSGEGFTEEIVRELVPTRPLMEASPSRIRPERIEPSYYREMPSISPSTSSVVEYVGFEMEVGETSETVIASHTNATASNDVTLSQIDVRQDGLEDPFDAIAGKLAEYELLRPVAEKASEAEPSAMPSVVYREAPRFDPASDPVYPNPSADFETRAEQRDSSDDPPAAIAPPPGYYASRPNRFGRLFTKLLKG